MSLHLSKCHIDGNHMLWLIFDCKLWEDRFSHDRDGMVCTERPIYGINHQLLNVRYSQDASGSCF